MRTHARWAGRSAGLDPRARRVRSALGGRSRLWTLVVVRSSASARQPTHVPDGFVPHRAGRWRLWALVIARSSASVRQPTHVPGGFVPHWAGRWRLWALVVVRSSALARQPTHVPGGFVPHWAGRWRLWALVVVRSSDLARQPTHVPDGFVPHPCGPVSFSCLPKRKSPKRRAAPAASPRAHPARAVRGRRPVAPTARPCADGAMSAIHRAPPAGRFGHRPPPLMGIGNSSALLRAQACSASKPVSSASVRQPTHVPDGFVPHPCGPVTFSCLPKRKSPKRRAAPAAAPRAHPARAVRGRRPVAPTAPPCADGAMSAIHRAPPAGRVGHRPPPLMGPANSSALLRAQAKQATSYPGAGPTACACNSPVGPGTGMAAQVPTIGPMREALARPRWPRGFAPCPVGRGGGAQVGPAGAARGIAPRLPQCMDALSANPRSAPAQSRAHDARVTADQRVPFLLVPFLWASKEKEPARKDAGRTHQGRGSVVAPKRTTERPPTPTSASDPPSAGRTHQGRESVVAPKWTTEQPSAQPSATPHTP